MINIMEVTETNKMVEKENLDVRTITMGINLLDCAGPDLAEVNEKIYNKITTLAKDLVSTGEEIAKEFGVPIVNKRISITPISLVGSSACKTPEDYVTIAKTLDKAAHTVGVNFIGGYSAVVSKGMTKSDELLIRSIPQALAQTELICRVCQCRIWRGFGNGYTGARSQWGNGEKFDVTGFGSGSCKSFRQPDTPRRTVRCCATTGSDGFYERTVWLAHSDGFVLSVGIPGSRE